MNEETLVPRPRKHKKPKRLLIVVIMLILLAGASAGSWLYLHRDTSPVPKSIRQSVNFPVYYPDPKKLPAGYTLSKDSFKFVEGQGVLYEVVYGKNQKLIFTVQQKPSATELTNFTKNYIPINRQVLTSSGTATEGAIGDQTVVSLPTNDKSWIIMTGPPDIYGTDPLAKIFKAMTKSR